MANSMEAGKEKKGMRCVSCGKLIESEKFWVRFPCPGCAKGIVIRCGKCKTTENKYKCPGCGFEGP